MSGRRIIDDFRYVHFITFGVDKKRRLLEMEMPREILLEVFNHQLDSFSAKCLGFVVMPDHVHLLVCFSETGQLSRFMHGLKRMSSFRIRKWFKEKCINYFQEVDLGDRFWLPKYYSFEIETQEKLEEKLEYIHMNPVRSELVSKAVDWEWSSARWYYLGEDVSVPLEWVD